MNIKITKKLKKGMYNTDITVYYANDLPIVETWTVSFNYPSPDSKIANKSKKGYNTNWNTENVAKLFDVERITVGKYRKSLFKSGHPDTRWGEPGFSLSMKDIKNRLQHFYDSEIK